MFGVFFFHYSPLKQQFAASRNKIDDSCESEPNSEVPDHKPNEPVDAKTLLAARNNCCVTGENLFGGEGRLGNLGGLAHITKALDH